MAKELSGIAAIVVTYNDDFKIKEWAENYKNYEQAIDSLIIVDNGSTEAYKSTLNKVFPNAEFIFLSQNYGTTYAYNRGIELALSKQEIKYILLIGNDIVIEANSIINMCHFLSLNNDVAFISPVLLNIDGITIDGEGYYFDNHYNMRGINRGEKYHKTDRFDVVEALPGGINIAKSEIYADLGLQDEKLFMYADEVDISLRVKKKQLKMVVDLNEVAIHRHINKNNSNLRSPYVRFLVCRNSVYLAGKHFGTFKKLTLFLYYIKNSFAESLLALFRRKKSLARYSLYGASCGFLGNMKLPKNFWV